MDGKKKVYLIHVSWLFELDKITFFCTGSFQLEATPMRSYSLYILWDKLNKEEIWNILQTLKYQW
jgi:hypothetical protein